MFENSGGVGPLNWSALVAEAIRRRKDEKLTQREHAALASVSIPTMIAFDRRERSLSLGKAMDILRVVGLLEETSGEESQESFVQEAFQRWRELVAPLAKDSPGRFPNGSYRIDYALDGDMKDIELHKFAEVVEKAIVHHTGWPLFLQARRGELAPYPIDGVLECWIRPGEGNFDRPFYDAAHCDFWRGSPLGRMFLIRGYQEDGQETIPAGTIFDTTLPIWRIGEAFLHAARLNSLIAKEPEKTTVRLRILYTGLTGRDLRAWASRQSVDYFGGGRSRSDEALLEGVALAARIHDNLAEYVYPLVSSLFERFGVTGISQSFVGDELKRMRENKFGNDAILSKRG
jgi:transcriptional regulator with XRE-family HTH domain